MIKTVLPLFLSIKQAAQLLSKGTGLFLYAIIEK